MVHVYVGKDRLDALRYRSFLSERGIDAEIQELPADPSAGQTAGTMVFVVCAAEGQAAAAAALLDEFSSIFRQTTDETEPGDHAADDQAPDNQPQVKARVPWLTLLYCAGCVAASFASWSLVVDKKAAHIPGWGWRDCLDVAEGSYWAIFTSVLPHQDAEHLVMNLLGIGILGLFIERAFGRRYWLALLLSCILVTNSTELAVHGQLGYGSSGALYSFYAFALIAAVERRVVPVWLMVPLSIWIGLGAVYDVAAVLDHLTARHAGNSPGSSVHLTGLAWGMLFAAAFAINWKPQATRTTVAILLFASLVPLRGSPWLAEWLIDRGERALDREGVSVAIDWYTRAVERDPKLPSGYVGRAGLLMMDGRFAEGLADVDRAIACQTEVPYARAERAQILLYTSDRVAALAAANDELNVAGPSGYGYAQKGVAHFDLNEFDAALADLERAIKVEPRASGHWVTRSSTRHELSQIDAALADAEHAVALDVHNADALMVRGIIYASLSLRERARNDLLEARSKYETELVRMPRYARLRCTLADTLLELFDLERAPARLASAREHAEAAVLRAPAYWEAWQVRGAVKLNAGEFDEAVKDLTRALELNPHDYWAACHRGLAWDGLSRPDEALRDLSRALAANPRFAYGYRSRALVRLRQGDFRGAIDDATVAIQLNPKFAEAYDIRGQARIAAEDQASGDEDLQRAVAIDPNIVQRRRYSPPAERGQSISPTD